MTTDLEELRKLAESVSIPHMSVDRSTILALVSELEALREARQTIHGLAADIRDRSPLASHTDAQRVVEMTRPRAALTKENSHV